MIKRLLFFTFLTASLLILPSGRSYSDDVEKIYQGVPYACSGVGNSQDDPRWKTYPLKLMFTAAGKAYVANVGVSILDSRGNEVLRVTCDAPWLLARLGPGTYTVSAQAYGSTIKRTKVSVPASGQNELAIRFPEIPAQTGNE